MDELTKILGYMPDLTRAREQYRAADARFGEALERGDERAVEGACDEMDLAADLLAAVEGGAP